MALHWLDIVVLAFYFVFMAALGFYFSRRNKNTEQYFVGGRSFGGWVIGISLVGYSISSVTFIGYPGDAYKTAWIRFIPNLMMPVAIMIASYLFIPLFRRMNITSAYEFLEGRFGPSIRRYISCAFAVGQLIRLSLVLYLVSIVVHEMTGLSPLMCILLSGLVTAMYTALGGIDAVIWTDVIQAIVLLFGGLLCLGFIVWKIPGGLPQIFTVALADGKLAFADLVDGKIQRLPWGFSLKEKTGIMMLILGLMGWVAEYSSNQNTIQRYIASKSTAEARKGILICCISSLPIWALFMFIGTALYVFFKQFPMAETTEMLVGSRKPEQVLPFFIMHYIPPGLVGLIIAGILAAAMSSLSASINSASTVLVVDIYKGAFARGRSDHHYLKAAWCVTGVVSVLMILGAIALNEMSTKTLQDTATIIMSLLGGGILGIYLLGLFSQRGDERAAWLGIAASIIFSAWALLAERALLPAWLMLPFDLYYTSLIGNLLAFLIALLAGLTIFRQRRDVRQFTYWHTTPPGDASAGPAPDTAQPGAIQAAQ
jgi:SSS family solute:Na+ symporter